MHYFKLFFDFGFILSATEEVSKNRDNKETLSKIFCAAASNRYDPNEYCNEYNDLFVSPDGKIKLCRYLEEEVDIIKEMEQVK